MESSRSAAQLSPCDPHGPAQADPLGVGGDGDRHPLTAGFAGERTVWYESRAPVTAAVGPMVAIELGGYQLASDQIGQGLTLADVDELAHAGLLSPLQRRHHCQRPNGANQSVGDRLPTASGGPPGIPFR